ncbi:DnaJ sub C member 7 [Thoreauomyces humboldtii]|nr:DnaJ sub C member 7 [Thoreauomyces humboldtii]
MTMKNGYKGFHPAASWSPSRISASSITPQDFFNKYVSTRTPCVISPFGEDLRAKWSSDYLTQVAGAEEVQVEQRDVSGTGGFGSGGERLKMSFADFLANVGGGNLYLTTQYKVPAKKGKTDEEEEEEEDEEDEDEDNSEDVKAALAEFLPAPLAPLLSDIDLRPALLGPLIPQTMNLWLGSSQTPTSSTLHHDFQDNLYTLLEGRKQFTIFSPKDADKMYLHGSVLRVAPNGYVHYEKGFRDDGANCRDVLEYKLRLAEHDMWQVEEADGSVAEICAAKERLEDVLTALSNPIDGEYLDDPPVGYSTRELPDTVSHPAKKAKLDVPEEADGKKLPPPSFSRIPTSVLTANEPSPEFPLLAKATRCTFTLNAGDALYLPAGWFHEVSSSNAEGDKPHMALNHWLAPPTKKSFKQCYKDDYWNNAWLGIKLSLFPEADE